MNENTDTIYRQLKEQLRTKAEAQLGQTGIVEMPQALAADKLLHELQVYQVELEMQNEELHRAYRAVETSRDLYADLYEFAPVGYLQLTTDGLIVKINLTGSILLGVARRELLNTRFSNFVDDEDKDRWYRLFLNMVKGGEDKHSFDMRLKCGEGSSIYVHVDCLLRPNEEKVPRLRVMLTDITKLKQAEAQLRIAAIAFESQEGMMVTDANNHILKVNRAFTETTGYTPEEAIGKTPGLLKSGHHDAEFYATLWENLQRTGSWQGEIWDRRKNGEIYQKWLIINAVNDEYGHVTHYVATMADITERKLAEDEIKRLAYFDSLTQLPNRLLLIDRLHQAMAMSSRTGLTGALLFIDMDNFKTLNDTLGHAKGDLLLQQVAQRLLACVREVDTVARLGGDEFVVILENLGAHIKEAAVQTRMIAEKILASLGEPYLLDGQIRQSSASIGMVQFNDHQHPLDELLKRADIAMYQAKAAGRDTLRFFDPDMQAKLENRAKLERDLHLAVTHKQFELYYQIQVKQDKAIGAEVLIRWQHPERGLVPPNEFIPIAEETGLILPIGQWVLETACAQLKQWQNHPRSLELSVNVSVRQFQQASFAEQVLGLLEKNGIDPGRLNLELTESLVQDDIDDAIAKMDKLKHIGVKISLDDFGTGYSSLSYLSQLPLDQLKIDQSFVRNIGVKPSDATIVQTIIAMAEILGMEVIAEGVETVAQRDFLAENGCLLYQGYLFSRPVPLEAFERLLGLEGI
jgi:diguanylate cyclase (GGDEF)-like protein/PAS domain S-box-containing protein